MLSFQTRRIQTENDKPKIGRRVPPPPAPNSKQIASPDSEAYLMAISLAIFCLLGFLPLLIRCYRQRKLRLQTTTDDDIVTVATSTVSLQEAQDDTDTTTTNNELQDNDIILPVSSAEDEEEYNVVEEEDAK